MKIEKVNDNQIRCTLTREDLAERQIQLTEIAYGSEKAKLLFRDMIQQANYEFGFEANDIPLMVEAIPASADSIILLITKVEYPEELDTRFSKFSEPDDDMLFSDGGQPMPEIPSHGADDILDLFRQIKEKQLRNAEADAGNSDAQKTANATTEEPQDTPFSDLIKAFEFDRLEQVEQLAHILNGYYSGENDLVRVPSGKPFCLLLHKSDHSPEEFNRVCNILAEYSHQRKYTSAMGAYLQEHGRYIIKGTALQTLSQI